MACVELLIVTARNVHPQVEATRLCATVLKCATAQGASASGGIDLPSAVPNCSMPGGNNGCNECEIPWSEPCGPVRVADVSIGPQIDDGLRHLSERRRP